MKDEGAAAASRREQRDEHCSECSLSTYDSAARFLGRVQTALERNEAINTQLLGVSLRLSNASPPSDSPPYLVTVEDGDRLLVAGCMVPPYNLLLSHIEGDLTPALERVVRDLWQNRGSVAGILAMAPVADSFRDVWEHLTGQSTKPGIRQRLFQLTAVVPPQPVPGSLRVMTEADKDLTAEWIMAFEIEALPFLTSSLHEAQRQAEVFLQEQSLYLWELPDTTAVTMAVTRRPLKQGISIGYVYTPHAYRGQGYASNCVAALSQHLLARGWTYCSLFTDLANPTSNNIYQKIGYQPVCDFNMYLFSAKS